MAFCFRLEAFPLFGSGGPRNKGNLFLIKKKNHLLVARLYIKSLIRVYKVLAKILFPLFPVINHRGGFMTEKYIEKYLRKEVEKLGVGHLNFHHLEITEYQTELFYTRAGAFCRTEKARKRFKAFTESNGKTV